LKCLDDKEHNIVITISHNSVDKSLASNFSVIQQSEYRKHRLVVSLKEKSNGQESEEENNQEESQEESQKESNEEEDQEESQEESQEEKEKIA
jgi:hypothetical protein